MKFFVNPRGGTMARQRYKSGPKKGQFMSDRAIAASKASQAKKRSSAGKKSAAKKSAPRRNPPRRRIDLARTVMSGSRGAVEILAGKAITRTVPRTVGLPVGGNAGLAVEALTAVAIGLIADRVGLPRATAANLLAGGLVSPIERLVAQYEVPFLSTALSGYDGLGYTSFSPRGARPNMGMASYATARNGMGSYAEPRRLASPRGTMGAYAYSGSGGTGYKFARN